MANQRQAPSLVRALRSPPSVRALEAAYLVLLALLALGRAAGSSTLPFALPEALLRALTWAALALVVWQAAAEESWSLKELVFSAVLALVCLYHGEVLGDMSALALGALILGARRISFSKIVRVYLAVMLAWLLLSLLLSLFGVMEDLVYEGRHSFGALYPTEFCARVFCLCCCWFWLRGRRVGWWELGGAAALALFCLLVCGGKVAALCLLLLAVGLGYVKLRRREKSYAMRPGFARFLSLAAPLAALLTVLLALLYTPQGPLALPDRALGGILQLGRRGFNNYPFTLLGQEVEMWGYGQGASLPEDYFFLSCSYLNLLIRRGLLTLLLAVGILWRGGELQRRRRRWERLGILAVLALFFVLEPQLADFAFHPFLLMALAATGKNSPEA